MSLAPLHPRNLIPMKAATSSYALVFCVAAETAVLSFSLAASPKFVFLLLLVDFHDWSWRRRLSEVPGWVFAMPDYVALAFPSCQISRRVASFILSYVQSCRTLKSFRAKISPTPFKKCM